jgi:nitronate monooxygenase
MRELLDGLAVPVIASPMFIVSPPSLVIAQCKAGIIGTMPSLNAREADQFEPYLEQIEQALAAHNATPGARKAAPYGINLIVHKTNTRLEHDLAICVKRKVPLIITSLGASKDIIKEVHAYGGRVIHDVINMRHARKAIGEGVDGLVTVCAGAGGHAGTLSPFALVRELRAEYDGFIALSGAISDGAGVLAAEAMGADCAYIGSLFIAAEESGAVPPYRQMVIDSTAADIVYSSMMTGVHGNYLGPSMVAAGIDLATLGSRDKSTMSFADGQPRPKAWKDVWGCGQGIGNIKAVQPAGEMVARLEREYRAARAKLCAA